MAGLVCLVAILRKKISMKALESHYAGYVKVCLTFSGKNSIMFRQVYLINSLITTIWIIDGIDLHNKCASLGLNDLKSANLIWSGVGRPTNRMCDPGTSSREK